MIFQYNKETFYFTTKSEIIIVQGFMTNVKNSQLTSFIKSFGGADDDKDKKINLSQSKSELELLNEVHQSDEPPLFIEDEQSNANQMQLAHLESLIQMKDQQIERLQAEIRTLVRIQNDQAIALEMALQDRRELEKQLTTNSNQVAIKSDEFKSFIQVRTGPNLANQDTQFFMENAVFLRAFLRYDQTILDDLVKSIGSITDQHTRGVAGQALFSQMQKYMELNSIFERLSDESGSDNFVATFEQNVRNLLDSRRVVLWTRIKSASVIVSRTSSMIVPEGEGFFRESNFRRTKTYFYRSFS